MSKHHQYVLTNEIQTVIESEYTGALGQIIALSTRFNVPYSTMTRWVKGTAAYATQRRGNRVSLSTKTTAKQG